MKIWNTTLFGAQALLLVLSGCSKSTDKASSSSEPQGKVSLTPSHARAKTRAEQLAELNLVASDTSGGPGGQRRLVNPEAVIPPQCYTRTEGRHNPCYVCHQAAGEGEGGENRINDGTLQGSYEFSHFAIENHWSNLFVDRSQAVAAISDQEILAYVNRDNYAKLRARMGKERDFSGYIPDLENLELGARAFDEQGFAKDASRWVALNYMPMPSTFWPTNGSTDDVMIRLPAEFQTKVPGGPYSHEVYKANLAILEAAIKNLDLIETLPIDERQVGADLDGDGRRGRIHRLKRPRHFVGSAQAIEAESFLFPRGTEFLHSVRYIAAGEDGGTRVASRMKELRYMVKHSFIPKHVLAGLYDNEIQEKLEGNPPYYADFRERGLDNGFGWRVQGYIEDAQGELRPNTYEETLFCMGCHSTVGSTIDHTFAFARKMPGPKGFGYVNYRGMPDAPAFGEEEGQIRAYLRRVGGGSEFRNNEEMQRRFFKADGSLDDAKVSAAKDVYELISPSRERALLLNKAYRVIVLEQSFLLGRDATVTPPANVFNVIDREVSPLEPEHRHTWDLRVAWPASNQFVATSFRSNAERRRLASQ